MKKSILTMLLVITAAFPACGSVVISGTRVIYPATEREVTVKMENKGSSPVLIQSWVDNGDQNSTPDTAKAPFLLTPRLTVLMPEKDRRCVFVLQAKRYRRIKSLFFILTFWRFPPWLKAN